MQRYSGRDIVNVGWGEDISIADLAQLIGKVVGYRGRITLDPSRPDGTPRKLVDTTRLTQLGWRPRTSLAEGLPLAYRDFLDRFGDAPLRTA
jgi:GDP-L-fucose synthase